MECSPMNRRMRRGRRRWADCLLKITDFQSKSPPLEPLSVLTNHLIDLKVDPSRDDEDEPTKESLSSSPESGVGSSVASSESTTVRLSPQAASIFNRIRSMSESYQLNGHVKLRGILKRPLQHSSDRRVSSERQIAFDHFCSIRSLFDRHVQLRHAVGRVRRPRVDHVR